jgi:regulator of nonsense transcripts 3
MTYILRNHSAAKPSRPSRAFIHVTSQSHVPILGDQVRQMNFIDAAKSNQDPALIGPPALEYAPYHRMPGGRRKHDNRQGTIDQDKEFQDFLESLTNPITKPTTESEEKKPEKVKTTPLIEAIRERKANKDKPQTKSGKLRGGAAKDDADKTEKKILSKADRDAAGEKSRKSKADKAAKDAVKVLNKEASAAKDGTASASTEKSTASPAPERKRGNASIAKSMLQRDLGIGPAANRRRGTKREITPAAASDASAHPEETAPGKQKGKEAPVTSTQTAAVAASDKTVPASPKKPSRAERRAFKATLADRTNNKNAGEETKGNAKSSSATPAPTILKKPQTASTPTPPKGPAASRVPASEAAASRAQQPVPPKTDSTAPSRSHAQTPTQPAAASPAPPPTGKQAFLKHANPSQGITEPLIEEALKVFGAIDKVEIDKRKGFAYVDFADTEGLQKAIAGSPVKVAQGAVQVLERKEKVARPSRPHPGSHGPHGPPTGPARGRGGFGGRGRGRGGARGGGNIAPNAPAGEASSAPAASASAPPAPATTESAT